MADSAISKLPGAQAISDTDVIPVSQLVGGIFISQGATALQIKTYISNANITFPSVTTPLVQASGAQLTLQTVGAFGIIISPNSTNQWQFANGGNLIPINDAIVNLGTGAKRVLTVNTTAVDSGVGTLTLKGATTTAVVITGANVVFSGTIKGTAGGYLSSDGTVGLTQGSTSTTGKSITVKDGLITAFA